MQTRLDGLDALIGGIRTGLGAQLAAYLQAVGIGQHQIQDEQLRQRRLLQARQAAGGVGAVRQLHGVVLQVLRHHVGQALVVVDHQNPRAHGCDLVCIALAVLEAGVKLR